MEPTLLTDSPWRLLIDPPGDPAASMNLDAGLAERVRRGLAPPTLRIYRWDQPAISIGRSQRPEELPQELMERGLPIVRRPTGGGAVIHSRDELTYALTAPRSILPIGLPIRQLHSFLHRSLRDELIQRIGVSPEELWVVPGGSAGPATVCFSSPVCGDLMYRGRKIAGSALRVWREAFLVQGSIQGFPSANGELQSALMEAVSTAVDPQCPHPLSKPGI